ncbi:MAG: cell division protein ZapA [Capnocytophaga sp.]|nr:cell division protein ZapA [Capnocytophaga sp.]
MSELLKIKLSIGDRVYPLNIAPEQEEGFRKAAKNINEMIREFETNYELKDKRDALAMCTIVLATRIEQEQLSETLQDSQIKEKLEAIHQLIDSLSFT